MRSFFRKDIVQLITILVMLTLALSCVREGELSADTLDPAKRRTIPERPIPPKGNLQIHVLTSEWICVVGDYYDFLVDRLRAESGPFLARLDTGEVSVPAWSYDFHYKFAVWDIISDYRPVIRDNFQDPSYFTVAGDREKGPVSITESAYWIEAVGQMRVPRMVREGLQDVQCAQVAHYAYLHLEHPLEQGGEYTVKTRNGETVSFIYDDADTLSWAIKVNQVGYLPDAGEKFGYLGMWLGDAGPLDLAYLEQSPFHLVDEDSDEIVFTGSVRLRKREQFHHTKEGLAVPVDGEDVYELDFSSFSEPGRYHIQVPGVGISWSFSIGEDALGYSYYTHIRGLYHQRSGIAKGEPYTKWVMGAGHTTTFQGGFAPNDRHYRQTDGTYGFFDEEGNPMTYSPFAMVEDTKTDIELPDVWGGWYDAGDFDRRMYHFSIVEDLLTAYFMYPRKFPDGQLDIPESGNGIPDIIDEAVWGIDVWYRAQQEDGGVGCWIEATSHPQEYDPAEDKQRYYLAAATRESSLQYAAHAAMLARAYDSCGQPALADRYAVSAEKAFRYAVNPDNRADITFVHREGAFSRRTYRYLEPEELDGADLFKAAGMLYLATRRPEYRVYLTDDAFEKALSAVDDAGKVYSLMYIYLNGDEFPDRYVQSYSDRVIELADRLLMSQDELAYRTINWPLDHGYFQFMAWGTGLPYNRGRAIIAAYRMTGESKYRDAALLLVDWMNGANPQGRSLTTGIGHVYPIRILSLPSIADGILEPIPGITLFTYTGNVHYQAKNYVYAMHVEGRADHDFEGKNIVMLSDRLTGGASSLPYDRLSALLDETIPIYRRFSNVEHLIVSQNEFTVWETIAPAAAFTACLIPDGWMPQSGWVARDPVESLQELPGYLPQP